MSKIFPYDIPASGICLVSLSMNSDMQNSLYAMFSALDARGYEVWTVGAKDPVCSNAKHTSHNIYVDCPARPGIAKGTFDIAAANHVVAAIRSTGCKTVYFESVHLWNCYVLACLGKKYTRVTTLHDVVPHDGSKSVLACQKLQCRLSDFVAIKSEAFCEDCSRLYGVPAERILTVGVFREWPPYEPGVGDGSCLFFGRVRKYKGLPAMDEIVRSMPMLRFTIMGSPDDQSRSALDAIKDLPNCTVVDREVMDTEMEEAFRQASWVLLPYENASQSGVIIDAYKYGRPVVAFDVGAIGNQVMDGVTGFLVPAGDIDAFISKVKMATAIGKAEYSQMTSAFYDFGRERYSAEAMSDLLITKLNLKANKGH